ncbi:MAG: glycosyltransferase [Candidatus Micrarchaeaceae archaeon]
MNYIRKSKPSESAVNFVIPVYNEEKNINTVFLTLYSAIKYAKIKKWKIYFALHKSTDNSLMILEHLKARFPRNITVLNVNHLNKTASQKAAIKEIKNNGIIIFVDCDVKLDKRALIPIIRKFKNDERVIMLGGRVIPYKPKKMGFFKSVMFYSLNMTNLYSKILIPKYGSINSDGSKNFFHGRFFALRSKSYWIFTDERFPDDVIFIDMIYQKFGIDGTFCNLANSKCYYKPYLSLREHYISHLRNYFLLKNLYLVHPNLRKFSYLYENNFNYKYLFKLPKRILGFFLIWSFISSIESALYYLDYNINKKYTNGIYLWREMKNSS